MSGNVSYAFTLLSKLPLHPAVFCAKKSIFQTFLNLKQQQHDINFEEDSEKKIPSPKISPLKWIVWTQNYFSLNKVTKRDVLAK